jgi:hypothetical protein
VNPTSPAETVLDEVATWAGITSQPTPRGATAILFEGHELGHVHANRSTLDIPLGADRRAQVLEPQRLSRVKWVRSSSNRQVRLPDDDRVVVGHATVAPLAPSCRRRGARRLPSHRWRAGG